MKKIFYLAFLLVFVGSFSLERTSSRVVKIETKALEYKEGNYNNVVSICNSTNSENENVFIYKIESDNFESWIELKENSCQEVSVSSEDLKITSVEKQNYLLDSVEGLENGIVSMVDGKASVTYKYKYLNKNYLMNSGSKKNLLYGDEVIVNGTFLPRIEKKIDNEKDYYLPGERVNYIITIYNDEEYDIKDVRVEEKMWDIMIVPNDLYEIIDDNTLVISSIPAKGSVKVYANYVIKDEDYGVIENIVEVTSATAENGNTLRDEEIKAEKEFVVKSYLNLCKSVINSPQPDDIFVFMIKNTSKNNDLMWVELKNNECEKIILDNGTYSITEIDKVGYKIKNIEGIAGNGGSITINSNDRKNVTFVNEYTPFGYFYGYGYFKNRLGGT